jgi:excisionase family DNA binding protein
MRERGTIEEAVEILGLPMRTVQAMAARGGLPGAAKIGRRWTFGLAALRQFVKEKERQACLRGERPRVAVTGVKTSSGAGRWSTGDESRSRSTQILRRMQRGDSKPPSAA